MKVSFSRSFASISNPDVSALCAEKEAVMRNLFSLFILFVVLVTAGAPLSGAADEVRYDGVAKAEGLNDTMWLSDGQLYNPTDEVASATVRFIPRGDMNIATATVIPVPPVSTVFIEDILAELSVAEGVGSITIEGAVLSWIRTFNKDGDETFGQNLPQVNSHNRFEAGSEILFPFSTPENTNEDFRSNLILVNLGDATAQFTVTSGDVTKNYWIESGVYKQINDLGNALHTASGWATCTISSTQEWFGYVSTVDPHTGDPATIEGLTNSGEVQTILYTGIAKANGAQGTSWMTDGVFYNPNGPENLFMEFIPRGSTQSSTVYNLNLNSNQTVFVEDILELMGAEGVGTLRTTGRSLGWLRTFNSDDGNTFGQNLPGVTVDGGYDMDQELLFPFSYPENTAEDFRSNLILLNNGSSPAVFTVKTAQGTLNTDPVEPGVYVQLNNFGKDVAQSYGWHSCTVSADQPWYGFVSTVDPRTGDPATVFASPMPVEEIPPSINLWPGKSVVCEGSTTTLYWESSNANLVTINDEPVEPSGSMTVSAGTYVGYVENEFGTDEMSITVTEMSCDEPTINLWVDESEVCEGSATTLHWSSTDADVVTINGDTVPAEGTMQVNAGTYVGIATNDFGTDQETVTVTEISCDGPAITLWTDESEVCPGTTTTLHWSSTNADSVTIEGQPKSTSGTMEVGPGTYTGIATNDYGTDTDMVTVDSLDCDPPTLTLWVDDDEICSGDTTTLHWSSTKADNVTINGQPKSTSGTMTVGVGTYNGVASNDYGTDYDSATVSAIDNPNVTSASVSPSTVDVGDTVTVSRSSDQSISATEVNWGDGTTNSNLTHSYTASGTYTVRVRVQNECGNWSDWYTVSTLVTVNDPCEPFDITQVWKNGASGFAPLTITFQIHWEGTPGGTITLDVSDGDPIVFTNVQTSPVEHVHTFENASSFPITASGSNACGSDSMGGGTVIVG